MPRMFTKIKSDRSGRAVRAACLALALLVLAVAALAVLFRHELLTLSSLRQRSPGVYTMTYDGDYGFDEFLKTGASSDRDIEAFVTKRLLKGIPLKLNVTGAGCTAFVTRNENGGAVFARNFDFTYSPFVQLHTNPSGGYASVSTVNLSFAGYSEDSLPSSGIAIKNFLTLAAPFLPFDGMNEKGVAIALLAVPRAEPAFDPEKVTLNTTAAIRLVLDKAADIDEAVSLLRQYNIYFSGGIDCHYLIADASGKSVLVEYYDGGLQVVRADTDYQIASNFIAYNGVNIGEGFTEFARYDAVEQFLLRNNNAVTMSQCEDILNEIGVFSGAVDKLQWSVIYNITEKTGRIWPHRRPDDGWEFGL